MALDETAFEKLATATLSRLADAIEDGLADHVEVEFQGGILTVDLDDGGQYVINKHGPNRQIWLSSPKSGAWHFAWDEAGQAWASTRAPAILEGLLSQELSAATGVTIEL
ncbi:MAG: iron donor protein CyaY [Alphaproteobacteria bacterium]|nr:iron donor protein CyaY [Alphaproteobacteria bacterium]